MQQWQLPVLYPLFPKVASGASPAKVLENRSKLYKQLGELQNLQSMGVLNDDEYQTEKKPIMGLLHQLKTKQHINTVVVCVCV